MLDSSKTTRSVSSRLSLPRLKPKVCGSNSSRRWMVLASRPVDSVSLLAALPVGAQRVTRSLRARRIPRMLFTRVVLPTPGPPVMTITLLASASRTASRWEAERVRPVSPSTQGIAFSATISPQGGAPGARRERLAATPTSARYRGARKRQGRPEISSGIRFSSMISAPIAWSMTVSGISSRAAALRRSSSRAAAQWPRPDISCSTCLTPAWARRGESWASPSLAASASAVLKPTPWMSRASR